MATKYEIINKNKILNLIYYDALNKFRSDLIEVI